jgi:hypothetical protein
VHIGKVGPPPPPPSAEEVQHAHECANLSSAASAAFSAASANLQIDQCSKDTDCNPFAPPPAQADFEFSEESDGCWSNCESFAGTKEYIAALKPIANNLCSDFRSKGCLVVAVSCPPPGPVVWTCVNAKCVSTPQ